MTDVAYANGRIPLSLLVHLGGDHYLMPGTYRRWVGFTSDVLAETGVALQITPGANGYRWFEKQIEARNNACAQGRCRDAADPGDSSHGGLWRGRETCAVDVGNYWAIPWSVFKRLAEKWGFIVLYFDWEPWHIIDPDPWNAPAAGGVASSPRNPISTTGVPDMMLFNGITNPGQYYLATYDGRTLKVRPTVGVEAKLLLGAVPAIPRGQLTDAEVTDLCAQGGYVFKGGVGYYDGVPGYQPPKR